MRIGLCRLCGSGERQDHLFGPVCFLTQHLSALCSQIPWGFWVRVDSSSELGRFNSSLSMPPSWGSSCPHTQNQQRWPSLAEAPWLV